jgi:hypothetical protein
VGAFCSKVFDLVQYGPKLASDNTRLELVITVAVITVVHTDTFCLDKWQFLSLVHFSAVKEKYIKRKEGKTDLMFT